MEMDIIHIHSTEHIRCLLVGQVYIIQRNGYALLIFVAYSNACTNPFPPKTQSDILRRQSTRTNGRLADGQITLFANKLDCRRMLQKSEIASDFFFFFNTFFGNEFLINISMNVSQKGGRHPLITPLLCVAFDRTLFVVFRPTFALEFRASDATFS